MIIQGKIEKVAIENGQSQRGAWTRWVFHINEKKYSTFDEGIGNEFKTGDFVEVELEQKGKYMNMVSMRRLEMINASPNLQNLSGVAGYEFERIEKVLVEILSTLNQIRIYLKPKFNDEVDDGNSGDSA